MPAEIIPFRPTFDPARVELTSPGTQAGLLFYVVDIVEAATAAIDCAEGGLSAVDLTGPAPRLLIGGTVH